LDSWNAIFADAASFAEENAAVIFAILATAAVAIAGVRYMRLHQRFTRLERAQIEWLKTFDSIEDLILVHDNNYQVVRVNRALAERLGRLPVEAVGKTCDILLPRVAPGGTCPYCVR